MSGGDLAAEGRRWLGYACEDLAGAERLAEPDSGTPPRHVCMLAQQAAEKAVKALLILQDVDFPRTHDLDALVMLLRPNSRLRADFTDLAELSEWAVESRYPGQWPEARDVDARAALYLARLVVGTAEREFAELEQRAEPN